MASNVRIIRRSKSESGNRRKNRRDARGRFVKGVSGNPRGRPPHKPIEPRSLAEELALALLEQVRCTDAKGKSCKMTRYERIVQGIVREIEEATPKEALDMLLKLEKLGTFSMMASMLHEDEGDEERITEAHRRFLANARAEAGLADD